MLYHVNFQKNPLRFKSQKCAHSHNTYNFCHVCTNVYRGFKALLFTIENTLHYKNYHATLKFFKFTILNDTHEAKY